MSETKTSELSSPRIYGVLVGDIANEPTARVKYGYLFEALMRRFETVETFDATLRGAARLSNMIRMVHPDKNTWRQRFYKNVPAFRARSRKIERHWSRIDRSNAVALQINVLFDASWGHATIPNVIYTDYTARLSASKADLGRSPFTQASREQWIALEKRAFERAAHICTRSDFVRQSIIDSYGISPEDVTVVGGGANLEVPTIEPPNTSQPPTALFIGKDFVRKGGDILLKAFALARKRVPAARLLFVSRPPIPRSLPLDGVDVLEPSWSRQKIEQLYRRADVFVLPSRLETWGDVLLEAMAFGLPCIGVSGESMGEIIQAGETGHVVPPDSVEALADALVHLFTESDVRHRWGRAARRRYEQYFSWDRVVDRLVPICSDALARQRLELSLSEIAN